MTGPYREPGATETCAECSGPMPARTGPGPWEWHNVYLPGLVFCAERCVRAAAAKLRRCDCHEPLEPGHRCWATQAAELEALREVERAARSFGLAWFAYRSGGTDAEWTEAVEFAGYLRDAIAKLDEVRR